jgi:hypothetical protein
VRRGPDQVGGVTVPRKTSSGSGPGGTFRAREVRLGDSRAGVTQLAECLLPKSERLSAVAPLVVTPGFQPQLSARVPGSWAPRGGLRRGGRSARRGAWVRADSNPAYNMHGPPGAGCDDNPTLPPRRPSFMTFSTRPGRVAPGCRPSDGLGQCLCQSGLRMPAWRGGHQKPRRGVRRRAPRTRAPASRAAIHRSALSGSAGPR